jgi:hypothetical protein
MHIAIVYVAAVLPQMHGYASATGKLGYNGSRNRLWLAHLASFSNSCNVVYVNA